MHSGRRPRWRRRGGIGELDSEDPALPAGGTAATVVFVTEVEDAEAAQRSGATAHRLIDRAAPDPVHFTPGRVPGTESSKRFLHSKGEHASGQLRCGKPAWSVDRRCSRPGLGEGLCFAHSRHVRAPPFLEKNSAAAGKAFEHGVQRPTGTCQKGRRR